MKGIARNNKNKIEKNANILEGDCIFPFKKKYKLHSTCIETKKGPICATEINPKSRTLKKYGYCISKNNTLKKKQRKSVKKLKIISSSISKHKKRMAITEKKRYNEEFIQALEEITDIMARRGDHFKARAYKNAIETITLYPENITDPSVLKDKPGIGASIFKKLNEYVETGTIALLEKERNNPLNKLTQVYGIGRKKAEKLIEQNITSIDQLKEASEKDSKLLHTSQKLGLEYYADLQERIPRAEIEEYQDSLSKVFLEFAPHNSKFEIVGSFRRNKDTSGDIDIVMTNNDNNTNLFDIFLDALIQQNVVIETLSRGKTKSLTIGKLPNKPARRLDFLYSPPSEYSFATLYFTGSKNFNTAMRAYALTLGYSLNEHGLSIMENKKKGALVNAEFDSEESIFKFLGLQYIEPNKRVGIHDIIPINATEEIKEKEEEITKQKKKKIKLKIVSLKNTKPKKKKLTLKNNIEKLVLEQIEQFKKEGESALDLFTEEDLSAMIRYANDAYYGNNNSILTDNQYDILREYTLKKYPSNKAAQEGHTQCVIQKNKATLPYEMWSMDKIKPDTNALKRWVMKYNGPYVISCKLDGVSGLYSTEGNEAKLYTRGNGKIGQDISHLIPYLKLPSDPNIVLRGEFIIQKEVFTKKYADTFSNSRNFVAGIINQKTISTSKLADIDFVAYEVIKPDEITPSQQMAFLNNLQNENNIISVRNETVSELSNEFLSEILTSWRNNYEYEIDGIIVSNDAVYPRTHKNPKHAFAFKMVLSEQMAEAKVVDVIWTASKHGLLKPRVKIEPVVLGGAKIEYATGFNGKFIKDNNIGVGAVVSLIRSGDVIPHITAVIQPAPEPLMPTEPYIWNEAQVEVILQNITGDATVNEKIITNFFTKIDVDGFGPGNAKLIIAAGFDSIPKIVNMSLDDFKSVDRFKEKKATKIYNSIQQQLAQVSLPKLIAASNVFGRSIGERVSKSILDMHPDILISTESDEQKLKRVLQVPRIGKIGQQFVAAIPNFIKFVNEINLEDKLNYSFEESKIHEENNSHHELFKKTIVFTGGKDKILVQKLEDIGAKIGTAVTKNIFILIAKDKESNTGKVAKANDLGIKIMTIDDFKHTYTL